MLDYLFDTYDNVRMDYLKDITAPAANNIVLTIGY
jgi:hypothetical protein